MGENNVKSVVGKVFSDIASGMETGQFGTRHKVGITVLGNEHGVDNLVKAAEMAARVARGYDIVIIGPKDIETDLELVAVETREEGHEKMEELLDEGYLSACVTMSYPFPIGVSTVGRIITPARGNEMFVATTTGTSVPHRAAAMVKNAVYGIACAKATGIANPTVGLLNIDDVRTVERSLNQLKDNGYDINFVESFRADGGVVMRGNDLLVGTPNVMVQDSLTGNIIMKIFASYATGGDYEAVGFGYGPGVGEGYDRTVLILSRACGASVAAGALQYAGELAVGNFQEVKNAEIEAAKKAGLDEIIDGLLQSGKKAAADEEKVEAPPKEIVTAEIAGIDILDLEDAVQAVWKVGIYAESGMGCTGPIVLVNEANLDKATEAVKEAGFI